MTPRIFINMHYLEIGGAERALLGLLDAIDTSRMSVDLFLNQHTGEFMPYIPKGINLLPEMPAYSAIERPMVQIIKEGHFFIACARLWAKVRNAMFRHRNPVGPSDASIFQHVANAVQPFLPYLTHLGKYDLAISFLTPHNIVLHKVQAAKKVAWIHTDYSKIDVDVETELKVWSKYDHIASISPDCAKAFLSKFPSLASKIIEIHNILSPSLVRRQAEEFRPAEYKSDRLNICSVGRICEAKNYDNVPHIARMLLDKGLNFHWHIVGPGNPDEILQLMKQTGTEHVISLLGTKSNPYPYIANCDIYLQPSRYEGNSVTVREAQILCRPVIITNYATAKSQVCNGFDGIICEMDNQSIANAIHSLATDSEKQQQLSTNLSASDFGNQSEVEKIYKLIL